ncbi:hypothetical protein HN014_21055 [Aquimarina sp. TRL1]|uniref:hypothetical protein n=1 Tax=Aquimarina sp. (strain TRL1) TaxID=2736252 RepID=UPI00158F05F2|nr:hypothetical protein [Aquimarina sp. TRL1]QKX07293.1 hypothetical protein HN014_21055 [Aquimarina sp. TRL1]
MSAVVFFSVVNLFELLAAIVGTVVLIKNKNRVNNLTRFFVWFLWFTVFVEVFFGWMPTCAREWNSSIFLKDLISWDVEVSYKINFWGFRVYTVFSDLFLMYYFKKNIKSEEVSKIVKGLMLFYFVFTICCIVFKNSFLENIYSVPYILGPIFIFISVMLYFFEILKSNKILYFHKELPFYIAIGSMIFNLVVTPLFIYKEYYSSENPDFNTLRMFLLYCSIIFLNSIYILGFYICFRKNKSY